MPNVEDIRWFKQQFSHDIEPALQGTPFDLDMLVAIACQETGEIWPILRHKPLTKDQIVALCVGDTLDSDKGRKAFPKTKAELVAKQPNGQAMFDIARKALVDMAQHITSYAGAASNPKKFCHGYGVFQRDLQFFLNDPDYFLQRKYEDFDETLKHCLGELHRGLVTLGFQNKPHLTDFEFACVAIAYNTGGFNPAKKLKQGHFNGTRFYGEEIARFLEISRTVKVGAGAGAGAIAPTAEALGRFIVIARGGLQLRKGPGLAFGVTKTLENGTGLSVLGFDGGGDWARVDLENDGLVDGHVFAAFLAPADPGEAHEHVAEPD